MLAKKILVVEDEQIIAKNIQNVLVKAGYKVPAIASSGEKAISKVKECKPDLVLMDIILQGEMDGIETAQQIRSLWDIPVIYLAAYGDDAMVERAMATEPIGYIQKPYDKTELLATIEIAFHQYKIARDREEENLRASEEKFGSLFQNLKDMVIISDVHSKTPPFQILEVNSAVCNSLGYQREELLTLTRVDIVPPEQRENTRKNLRKILHDGDMTFESSLVSKNGLIIPVEVHGSSFKFNRKKVVISVARDITSRKAMEMELNRVNRALKTLSECNQTLVRTTDEKNLLQSICNNIVEVGGYRLAWIGFAENDRAKSVRQMAYAGFNEGYLESLRVTWADTPRGRGPTGTAIRTKKPAINNNTLTDPDFKPWRKDALKNGYGSSIALPLFDNKQCVGALNIYSQEPDVFKLEETKLLSELAGDLSFGITALRNTEQKKLAEEVVREKETRYRRLFESAKDGIIILDAESGKITDINPFLVELLGYPAKELIGKELWEIGPLKDIIKSKEMFLELKNKGYVRYDDLPLETRNGIQKDVEFVTNVYDVNQKKVFQCNFRDITARKGAEKKRLVLQEIMRGLATAANVQDYLDLVHRAIAKVIFAENFFVILKDEKTGLFEEIYSIDKFDPPSPPSLLEKSISSYVFRTGSPLLLTKDRFKDLVTLGEVELVGTDCASWLGVPLITAGKTIGVMTVQDYDNPDLYSESDKEFMASIAGQVAQIVERKQVQEKLSESEAELRALFASMSDVVIVLDGEGTNLRIAPTNPSSLIKPIGEMVGKKMHDLVPKEQADFFVAKIQEAIQCNEIVQVEYSLLLNKKEHWFSTNISRLSENTVVWTAHDITKRKISEEKIRSRSEDLQALYDLSRALADSYDPDQIYKIACHNSVKNIHATFARIALLEGDELIIRSAFPIRVLDHDLFVGDHHPINTLSFCHRAIEQNKPIILHNNDLHVGEEERKALLLDQIQSLCLIPFQIGKATSTGEKSSGILILGEKREETREPFTDDKIRLAKSICEQMAGAIQRATLINQTENQLTRLTSLRRIDMSISGSFDMQLILDVLLEEVTTQLKVDAASVYVYRPNIHELELVATRGFGSRKGKHDHIPMGIDYPGLAALENRSFFIEDLCQAEESSLLTQMLISEGFVTYIAVPLMAKGEIKGVMEIAHRSPLKFSEDWLRFLEMLAGQGAIAIETTQLFTNLQRSNIELSMAYDATIQGWSSALDLRDQETEGHTQRVTEMTLQLAETFGFDEKERINIKRGALLHDIGKMGIPDNILLKPGQLSDEEWVTMRKHPRIAYELISPISYLRPATDIPYCHHEKWDGTGYPRGLKGEQIPIAARLFAIVDVYDALTNERPYRHAWSQEKTLVYIQENSGTHFDPELVTLFLKLIEKND